jgi:hypothetical protein
MVSIKRVTVIGNDRLYAVIAKLFEEYSTIKVKVIDTNVFEVKAWGKNKKEITVSL